MYINIDTNNFEEVVNTDKPVLLDFWAPWCGPCRMIAPIIEELGDDFKDSAVIAKINVDENQELAAKFQVRAIPTIILLKDKEVVEVLVGAQSKATLEEKINKLL